MQRRHHQVHTQQTAIIDVWELLRDLLLQTVSPRKKKGDPKYQDEFGNSVKPSKNVVFAQAAEWHLARWKRDTNNGTHRCKFIEGNALIEDGRGDEGLKAIYQQAREAKDDAQRLRLFQKWGADRARELRAEGAQMAFIPYAPSPQPEINFDL